ncbi:hypothetical protein Sste5344_009864 [Sporothrix stenoceras]
MTLIDDILDLEIPAGLCVNSVGNKVAYHTRTKWNNHKAGEQITSSIWIADVGKPKSAHRITDGTDFHDHSPRWSPNGRYLFFLSNRRTRDKNYCLYYLDINIVENIDSVDTVDTLEDLDGLPMDEVHNIIQGDVSEYRAARQLPQKVPAASYYADVVKYDVSSTENRSVLAFVDGPRQDNHVGGGASSLGNNTQNRPVGVMNNIRYATLASVPSMSSGWVRMGYVADVAWSGDGSQTVAVTRVSVDPESAHQYGSTFSVEPGFHGDRAKRIFHIPLEVTGGMAWVGRHVYFQSWNVPGDASSGRVLYRLDVRDTSSLSNPAADKVYGPDGKTVRINPAAHAAAMGFTSPGHDHNSESTCIKVAGGETNCVRGFRVVRRPRLNGYRNDDNDDILVHLQEGTQEKLVLLRANRTIYTTDKGIVDFAATSTVNETILVIIQGDVNHPSEVFSVVGPSGDLVQLSDHGGAFARQTFGTASVIECASLDGADGAETIDALFLTPTTGRRIWPGRFDDEDYPFIEVGDLAPETAPPYPTVVFLHDGPYSRATNSFDRVEHEPDLAEILAPLLLRAGVAVLQPNYRGGSGRGSRFASLGSAKAGGLGRHDVSDIVALTNAAVKQGLADPISLFVVGWSHGGYLAYMMALRNGAHGLGWQFRGALCGAAVSDWDTLALTSSAGYRYGSLSGHAPWRNENDAEHAAPSPLRELAVAVLERRLPPWLLILHGENDTLVPVSQVEGVRLTMADPEGHLARSQLRVDAYAGVLCVLEGCRFTLITNLVYIGKHL